MPAWIDTRYVQADLKITTGLIEPHLMAGYSGGRKVICPGIAALETVKVWHGPKFLEHPKADCGIVAGNPVHEENTRIALDGRLRLHRERLSRRRTARDLGRRRRHDPSLGSGRQVRRDVVKAPVPEPVDVVVTSCAGYPLDTTWYQAVKGLTGALPIVKKGGTIIMAASLSEGLGGPEFRQAAGRKSGPGRVQAQILGGDYFVMDQWQLEEFAKVVEHCKVKIVTDGLSPDVLRQCHVEPAATVERRSPIRWRNTANRRRSR